MIRSLELHVIFPQMGLALNEVVNDGNEIHYVISPLGNEHDVRKMSEREFIKSYGVSVTERLDEIELLCLQAEDGRLTNDVRSTLVRLGVKTEVVSTLGNSENPAQAMLRLIEKDKQGLAEVKDRPEMSDPVAGSFAPADPDPYDVETINEMLSHFKAFHLEAYPSRREDPAFAVLWPVRRVGEVFLAKRFLDQGLISQARDLSIGFTNRDPADPPRPPYWDASRGGIHMYEIPLLIDGWRMQVFAVGMKDKRGLLKRSMLRTIEMPAAWSLASVADAELEREAVRIEEFRRRQQDQGVEEVIEVIDEGPKHEFLVGVSSEGCVFGTMELQIKECFIPNFINAYRLQEISKYAREAAEFVNLYSKYRGINRFAALVEQLNVLRRRPEVRARGVQIPSPLGLGRWLSEEPRPSNRTLEEAVNASGDSDLALALKWSKAVNKTIAQVDHGVPPYPYVRETLRRLATVADILVVSAMPNKVVTGEWQQHGLAENVKAICGREAGTKAQSLAATSKFAEEQSLMIGDSPADLQAAEEVGCLFFPINPGAEEESWKRLFEEGVDRFLSGTFAGDYQELLLADFHKHLPAEPQWLAVEVS